MRGIRTVTKGGTLKIYAGILTVLILWIYWLENSVIASLIGSFYFRFLVLPLIWCGTAVLVWRFPNPRIKGKLKFKSAIYWWALCLSSALVFCYILAGFFEGFGKSPYDHSLVGVLLNITAVGAGITGRENVRSYLVNTLIRESSTVLLLLISLFMTVLNISLHQYFNIGDIQGAVYFSAQILIPEFTKNMVASYLALLGGPGPGIIYFGVLEAFHWLSPVLPELQWITQAFVGALVPLFSFMALEKFYESEIKRYKGTLYEESLLGWVVTCIVSICIVWFAVGVFPIYPSVIATGSMEPVIYPGDVILVEKTKSLEEINQIEEGDIIQFKSDDVLIAHRIVKIVTKDGMIMFQTKGDNNSTVDTELVDPENVKGRVVKVVPKVGLATLWLKTT